MNIYHPYEVFADTEECLHLKETEVRERIHFIIFRVLPLFILFFMWFIVQETSATIPMGWNYLNVAAAVLVSAVLLFHTYITEIKITGEKIFMVQKTVNGSKEVIIALHDVDKITFKRRRGKVRSAFFTLHTKKGKSYLLLSIPHFYTDAHRTKLIRERLQQMMHAEVV
jgi:hypothetical protein